MIVLLTLAFLLELIAFGSFAYAGFLLPIGKLWQVTIGLLLLILLIVFWSIYMSPKAPKKFKKFNYYIAKTLIYTLSAYVLFNRANAALGTAFVILALLDDIFLYKHNLS